MLPTKEQVIASIPNAEKEYAIDFDDQYDEANEKHVQPMWGPVRLLTTELAIRLPFDKPIVVILGDFIVYNGHYGIKKELLSTVSFSVLTKEHDFVDLTVNVMDGFYKECKQITFHSISNGKMEYLAYGTGSIPVYVYVE